MKIAREAGAILSYDPNLRKPLWPSEDAARDGILSIWNEADIIKVIICSIILCLIKSIYMLDYFHWIKSHDMLYSILC